MNIEDVKKLAFNSKLILEEMSFFENNNDIRRNY